MIFLSKILLFFCTSLIFQISSSKSELQEAFDSFLLTSDEQFHSDKGIMEASGNVIIEGKDNFKASADKIIFEKELSKLHLKGNVILKNFETEEIFIENATGNELIIFLDKGSFKFLKNDNKRVKTKFRF